MQGCVCGGGVKDGGVKDEDKEGGWGGGGSVTDLISIPLSWCAIPVPPCLRTVRTALIGTCITVVGYRQCLGLAYMIPELTDWHVQRK